MIIHEAYLWHKPLDETVVGPLARTEPEGAWNRCATQGRGSMNGPGNRPRTTGNYGT